MSTNSTYVYLQVPFFEQAGPAFIRDVATIAVMYYFPRGEIIQYSDTVTRELFCIHRGTCQVRSPIQIHGIQTAHRYPVYHADK